MGFELAGLRWSPAEFAEYVRGINMSWADSVTVHHTASPSLAQRPQGLLPKHVENLRHYYETIRGWSAGPHLFVDDTGKIIGLSSLWRRGVHARSFNASSIGIEMLGDFDSEDPTTGRGLDVIETTAECVAILLRNLGLDVTGESVHFHRDDPLTAKTCPGTRVDKDWFLNKVRAYNAPAPAPALTLEQRIARIETHLNLS